MLVKAEGNFFEYNQRALLETILIRFQCMIRFPTRNTIELTIYSLSLVLLLSIVLSRAAKIVSRKSHRLDMLQTIRVRFPWIVPLLFLVCGSSAKSADVDIQSTQRDVQNDDKWQFVRASEVFYGFSPS